MFCKFCGEENPDNAVYCRNCGKKLIEYVKKTEVIEETKTYSNNQSTSTTTTSSNDDNGLLDCCLCIIGIFLIFAIIGLLTGI